MDYKRCHNNDNYDDATLVIRHIIQIDISYLS